MSLLDEEGICMLSLDGGGVRGLSSLYVLKRIVDRHNVKRERLGQSLQKPVDIFDLTGGAVFQEKHLSKDDSSALAVSFVLAKGHRFNGALKHDIDRLEKLRNAESKAAEDLERGIDAGGNKMANDDPILLGVKNNLAYGYEQKGLSVNWPHHAIRSLYLAKSGGGANQRSHLALFIPNAEYDRDTISEDFRSLKAIGTKIHVVGEPLMSGFAFEIHRNYNTLSYQDLKRLVLLERIDDSILHNYSETESEIRENTPRSLIERVAESVTPPPKGQNIRAPIDGVNTERCQEWTMEVSNLLAEKGLIPSEAVSIAQKERDLPTKGIF
ncbi:hypothetical protein FANTH_11614 [Fusarium anthophilum]|uniref:PNPLA domain-containing protein n=1 Tax=Fusarium anthophilum TaxID=48485 RepID=A0A8H4YWP1_9HYPO|nr:hypothetical protein FANTH_11614 [Fusarium anthophilum]